jgi:hypothetical protein
LPNDRFAEREISKMLDVSRQHLSDALDQILGFRRLTGQSQGASWFYKGAAVELPSTRSLLGQLSQIFDEVYHLAPRVKNELVNRDHLSSAAAAARMRLIERVYEHPSSELLGMDPTRKPPEMSMYLSVLKAAELHRKSSDGFEFALPRRSHDPCHVTPVFEMILRVLQQAGESKVALPVLAQALREPPYGLRDGLFLLFFAVFLALHEQDVALYEDGGFVRRVTGPEFARMAKRMDEFEVQYCRIAGVRREVFQRLLQMLTRDGQTLENTAEVTVLDIVRPMMSFLAGLPDFARQTRSLTEPCLRVRTVLIAAREPGALLFQELPQALGFPPFTATGRPSKGDNVEEFVETLRAALNELREAYPTLLARQTAELCKAFELPETTTAELRETLARRAQRLVFAVREPSLRALCMRLSDTKLGDDAWLEALGSLICAKPPGRWTDSDEVRFRDGLGLRATHFQSAESLVFPGDSAMPQQERAVRLSVMLQDGVQVERVIRLNPQDAGHVDELRARMTELLGGRDRKVSLAALSEVLLAFLDMQQDGGGQSAPGGA